MAELLDRDPNLRTSPETLSRLTASIEVCSLQRHAGRARCIGEGNIQFTELWPVRNSLIRNALAALAAIIYAVCVLSLHQERVARFAIEEDGPIPVALSHFLYGSEGGLVDSGLIHYFEKDAADLPAEEAVERAAHGAAPRTRLLVMPLDGDLT
jgi:hypothetical protein